MTRVVLFTFLLTTKKQASIIPIVQAGVAQLVEYKLPKLGVAGSIPVARSRNPCEPNYGLHPPLRSSTLETG